MRANMLRATVAVLLVGAAVTAGPAADPPAGLPRVVGHRGIPRHAPEQTAATFNACIDLRVDVEFDVRRTRDGHLVCVHDATVDRTTTGTGNVSDLTLAELQRLDAGRKFDPAFAGERVLTLDAVFALISQRKSPDRMFAVDLKVPDTEAECVKLAEKHGVLKQLVFIGLTIDSTEVRRKLRAANPAAACAALCPAADTLAAGMKDETVSWVYLRFIPTAEQVKTAHAAGKKVFLVGPLVMGNEPGNWAKARAAGVDAILTDHPLECRAGWRTEPK